MTPPLEQLIYTIRDRKVILDADLAAIYAPSWPRTSAAPAVKK
jgi:hypothetical protein